MTCWWINEWRSRPYDLSVLNVTISRRDVIVVVMGFGFGVAW